MDVEYLSNKLANHLGKYAGLFDRLCVAFHCINNASSPLFPTVISADLCELVKRSINKLEASAYVMDTEMGLGGTLRAPEDLSDRFFQHRKTSRALHASDPVPPSSISRGWNGRGCDWILEPNGSVHNRSCQSSGTTRP